MQVYLRAFIQYLLWLAANRIFCASAARVRKVRLRCGSQNSLFSLTPERHCIKALSLFLLFFALPAMAESVFVIDNIYADRASDTPTMARNLAIEDAQAQGFQIVINRLTDPNVRGAIPRLSAAGITTMVKSFEITEEKITGNRYQARFNVFYNEAQIKEFLSQNKVDILEVRSPPILVLPIFNDGEHAILWDPENPWRKAWREALNTPSEINLIAPIGDGEDIQAISVAELKEQKWDALLAFANKYGAREVLVADAFFVDNGKMLVTLLRPVGESPTLANLADFRQELDASGDGFWQQSVASIQQKIVEQWAARGASLTDGSPKKMNVIVALATGKDWVEMRNKLEMVGSVSEMKLQEISLNRAVIELEYRGSLKKMQQELDAQALELLQEGDSWVLRKGVQP